VFNSGQLSASYDTSLGLASPCPKLLAGWPRSDHSQIIALSETILGLTLASAVDWN